MACLLTLALAVAGVAAAQDTDAAFRDYAARAAQAREANKAVEAMALYRQALELNPGWQEGWWYLGSLAYDSDQYEAGRDALTRLTSLNAQAGPGWALLGLCEFELKLYPSSLEHVQRALNSGGGDDQITQVLRYHEALLLARLGAFEQALQKYAAFVSAGPPSSQIVTGLGIAAAWWPRLPAELSEADRELASRIGQAAYKTIAGRPDEALQIYQRLLAEHPDSAAVYYTLGIFLLKNEPERALAELERARAIDPRHAGANSMLAWIDLQNGEAGAALPLARQAFAEDARSGLVQLALGRALVATGSLRTGLSHIETAARLDPSNIENHLALATAYSKAGRQADAWNERQLCLKMSAERSQVAQP